jgi:Protein of unknown function (DUF2946)
MAFWPCNRAKLCYIASMRSFIKKFGLRFALLGLLLNVLWPLLANANPDRQAVTLMICTSAGLQKVSLGQTDQNSQTELPASDHMAAHCPLCVSAGNVFIATLADANRLLQPVGSFFVALIESTRFFTATPHLTPPSHAPPLS